MRIRLPFDFPCSACAVLYFSSQFIRIIYARKLMALLNFILSRVTQIAHEKMTLIAQEKITYKYMYKYDDWCGMKHTRENVVSLVISCFVAYYILRLAIQMFLPKAKASSMYTQVCIAFPTCELGDRVLFNWVALCTCQEETIQQPPPNKW